MEKKPDEMEFIPTPPIEEPAEELPKYLWSTPSEARHSARVIMDENKLAWDEKNLLCAVIAAESGFNTQAVNKATGDYGICQINAHYWIGQGKYFASIEEVLSKPEKSVQFMIDKYKAGKLSLWTAYSNKSYKEFLV